MSRGMRIGKRVGGVRVSAGRGGVRVGTGVKYGRARAGVSYSSSGGFGYGASYGTPSVRVGTNGHRIGVGVTGKTGPVSYGAGVHVWGGHHAPCGMMWFPTGRRHPEHGHMVHELLPVSVVHTPVADWFTKHQDFEFAPFFRHPFLLVAILVGRFVTMIREAATPAV